MVKFVVGAIERNLVSIGKLSNIRLSWKENLFVNYDEMHFLLSFLFLLLVLGYFKVWNPAVENHIHRPHRILGHILYIRHSLWAGQ